MKSVSGLASVALVTAASRYVPPHFTITEPSACLASLPVSMVIVLPSPRSMTFSVGVGFTIICYIIFT